MPKLLSPLSAIAPPLAAEIGWRLWRSPGGPAAVHDRDRAVHEAAVRGSLTVGGKQVVTYRWGNGPRIILMVHGWRSRASRFSALVSAVAAPDRTILAFDAPGNGDSDESLVTVLDYAEAIRQIGEQYGVIDVIVGHSFGVLSTFVAVREGVHALAIVDIAGIYNADLLVDEFAAQIGIGPAAVRGMRRRIERRTFSDVADPWQRFTAKLEAVSDVALLVIHDDDDRVVGSHQSDLIAQAHTGPVARVLTAGLGHSRILRDPTVLAAVADFVSRVQHAQS